MILGIFLLALFVGILLWNFWDEDYGALITLVASILVGAFVLVNFVSFIDMNDFMNDYIDLQTHITVLNEYKEAKNVPDSYTDSYILEQIDQVNNKLKNARFAYSTRLFPMLRLWTTKETAELEFIEYKDLFVGDKE